MTTKPTVNLDDLFSESNRATYSPEDNKLRLYVGRVPRPEYDALRAEGWTSTPKQAENGGGDFAAVWTPERRNRCLAYAGIIEDEDQGPEDRAADRAARFGGYLDKRLDEATGHADRYSAGPMAHGYQSEKRAERAAARHDRIADRAGDAWSKAEYWQRRTAGVISHALYVSRPDVRMGRIKTLEAEQRKHLAAMGSWGKTWRSWKKLSEMTDATEQNKLVKHFTGSQSSGDYGFMHPRPDTVINAHIREHGSCLWTLQGMIERGYGSDDITGAEACALWLAKYPNEPREEDDWSRHYALRLAYENQMLEAQGGRLASVEIEAGGYIGGKLVVKVNKSSVTGRVTSVDLKGPKVQGWTYKAHNVSGTDYALYQFDTERMPMSAYTAPTDESRAELAALKAAKKAAAPKVATIPLVNPTDEDAERLQSMWNERERDKHEQRNTYTSPDARALHSSQFKPAEIRRITQATYSANSGGTYSKAETISLCRDARRELSFWNMHSAERDAKRKAMGPAVCKIRVSGDSVIILTDKPQKPLPASVWALPVAEPKKDDGKHTCPHCNHTAPREKWEASGSLMFSAGVVCPNCEMHQEAPAAPARLGDKIRAEFSAAAKALETPSFTLTA